jgi:geranylgeranyl diphosphate synthase type II
MDDADLRRGIPSLHRVFGESVALLTGLALLNQSYALLARAARGRGDCQSLIEETANCIGPDGMIGGQTVDLALRGAGHGPDSLYSRNLKTTALMRLTMRAGAVAGAADEDDAAALADFGESLGMAYQICDDLLDEFGASDELGKPVKQDSRHRRSNHVSELGVEGARRLAASLIEEGKQTLRKRFGARREVDLLSDAAEMILQAARTQALIAA